MKKYVILGLLIGLFSQFSSAQNSKIYGRIVDSTEMLWLKNAVVILSKSSTKEMVYFSRAKDSGYFQLNSVKPDTYNLLITYPDYADLIDKIIITPGENKNLGIMQMFLLRTIMQAVVVHGNKGPIRVKGDTTFFIADSFKTRDGDVIEDLLKKLPGFVVNSKGEISAQGKKVDKVLIDGEEFFGSDPTLATRNFDAKSVDKIALYNTKDATAGDNAQDQKVLDIRLKEDAKKGIIGKLTAGSDFQKFWETRASINAFKAKRKLALVNVNGNSPTVNTNWEEQNLTNQNNYQYDEETGSSWSYYNNDGDAYFFNGLPKSYQTALYYSNHYAKNKLYVTGNFGHRNLSNFGIDNNNSRTILANKIIASNSVDTTVDNKERLSGKIGFNYTLDSGGVISLSGDLSNLTHVYTNYLHSNANYELGRNLNSQNNITKNNSEKWAGGIDLGYKKTGKDFNKYTSMNVSYNNNSNTGVGAIINTNKLYKDSINFTNQNFTQNKTRDNIFNQVLSNFEMSRPINKKLYYKLNAGGEMSKTISDYQTKTNNTIIDSLSNLANYKVQQVYGGGGLKWLRKKFTYSLSIKAKNTKLEQTFAQYANKYQFQFFNILPKFVISRTGSRTFSFQFQYAMNNDAPRAEEVQPLRNNGNPLAQTIGNPNLKQSISQSVYYHAWYSKSLLGISIWSYGNSMYYNRGIADSSIVSENGSSVRYYYNNSGNLNNNYYINFRKQFNKIPIELAVSYRWNNNIYNNYINSKANVMVSNSNNIGFNVDMELNQKLDFEYSFNYQINNSVSSVQKQYSNKNVINTHTFQLNVNFTKSLIFSSDVNYNIRQKSNIYNQANNCIINAELKKVFGKRKSLSTIIGAYDLLNQNFGYNRFAYNNYVSEQYQLEIRRIIYAKIIWNFNTNKVKENEEEN